MRQREQNFQNVAWFWDLFTRRLLNLDPPYQRRSVWTQKYREDFVDTLLLDYPAPAIFLYETILEDGLEAEDDSEHGKGTGTSGMAKYAVVDGKQRLMAVFDFIAGRFPVGDNGAIEALRGLYYDSLPRDVRKNFLRYRFSVEYLPSENETEINSIFDRLNRNVKKLTPQELRHAKYDGKFITAAEQLSAWMLTQLPDQFPRIAESSRWQMKDVEIVATLLLYLEIGTKSFSTAELDKAFAERDEAWDAGARLEEEFRETIKTLKAVVGEPLGPDIISSRLRNQADFYSLFAAITDLRRDNTLPAPPQLDDRLDAFIKAIDHAATQGTGSQRLNRYLEAARSASNDSGPRVVRISIMKDVLLGKSLEE